MSADSALSWQDANQRHLLASLAELRDTLVRYIVQRGGTPEVVAVDQPPEHPSAIAQTMAAPPALDTLCELFHLSAFERRLLLLCAGMELDSNFATLCDAAHGNSQRAYPTFNLALAVFPEKDWSALLPDAPLRRWRMISVESGATLTRSPLRIDERVLHYLVGMECTDERLMGIIEPARLAGNLVPSHQTLAQQIEQVWKHSRPDLPGPVIQLVGDETTGKRLVAVAACALLRVNLGIITADAIPSGASEIEGLLRLWVREAGLRNSALLVDCDALDPADTTRASALVRLIEHAVGPVFVTSRERRQITYRTTITFDVGKPTPAEQRAVWHRALGTVGERLNGQVDQLVAQFNLNTQTIERAGVEARGKLAYAGSTDPGRVIWEACRMQARPRMDDLAQRIEPAATWDDLVLPGAQRQILRDMAAHVRQRSRVYEAWGFAAKGARGLGISALFAGASGTGKTMAAEVLAGELNLDLYRIDLATVVSKYIGETEKNLRRIFDAAEEGGVILLFDEADALFGKRSEVKDSHDRFANIEVSYLLQRMEAYRGLAILTTNFKSAIDPAFLRRIRFVVQFPFPDAAQRAEIWRHVFPAATPTEGLDVGRLARLNIAGGNIRNIALNAAFLAADADEAVRMTHLLRAARSEYAKLEKSLTESELEGWI